jgi:hypothetical protein
MKIDCLDNFHRDATWKGNDLIFQRRVVASIVPDSKFPQMWRVRLPDGHVTDMVNLSRARDAARSLALKALTESHAEAPPIESKRRAVGANANPWLSGSQTASRRP